MPGTYIVPVGPVSGCGETVVIQVQQESSYPLDVRLVGCEGENPYVTTIKHRNLAKLKHKFKGTDDEWAAILSHFLLPQQPEEGHHAGLLDGVRMVYTLKNDNLHVSFRQDVQGIKVTLGEIVLPKDDEFEFNPFAWAQTSAMAHAQTLQQLIDLKARVSSEQDTISKLNAQLDNLIKTKNETETAMLQQFMQLLNEKKRKIRDQSRLLAVAKVDKSTASNIQSTRATKTTRAASVSRTSKRKALSQAVEPDVAPDSDSDRMEIDHAKTGEVDDEEAPEAVTPDQSDDETDEEDEPAVELAPRARARSSETLKRGSVVAQSSKGDATEAKGVPPPRALPFSKLADRRKEVEERPSLHDVAHDEGDETEDEEL